MIVITIFNFIVNLAIISFLVYRYNPFWISIDRTFWMNKITSVTLMYRYRKSEYGSASKGVITIRLRDRSKWSDWDSKQYAKGLHKPRTHNAS
jgi:hypothetical protein